MFFFANYILLQCDIQPFAEYAVAPHVGAWIETFTSLRDIKSFIKSHPMWVRGLKPWRPTVDDEQDFVAPHVGAWIETCLYARSWQIPVSHPMWVRGLKLVIFRHRASKNVSHPMWVRGLKPEVNDTQDK